MEQALLSAGVSTLRLRLVALAAVECLITYTGGELDRRYRKTFDYLYTLPREEDFDFIILKDEEWLRSIIDGGSTAPIGDPNLQHVLRWLEDSLGNDLEEVMDGLHEEHKELEFFHYLIDFVGRKVNGGL
jgi:hypothetical protein